ncbi:Ig-like domain-containing protein [candidate division KSB1 bacterium]|nr:Ig-like domain-containing protein [candidate division KSB1 bacterium]
MIFLDATRTMTLAAIILLLLLGLFESCSLNEPISIEHERGSIAGMVFPDSVEATVSARQGNADIAKTKSDSTGYFHLRNLTVGVYNLLISAANYGRYTKNNVVVYEGGTTAIEDVYLKPMPEQILEVNPANDAQDHPVKKSIDFVFAQMMNERDVESAFDINPDVGGEFSWTSNSTRLSFIPTAQFKTNTEYTVTLSKSATTFYGDSLAFKYEFKFRTEPLHVIRTTPYDNANSVGTGTNIRIQFNSAMNRSSVENAFSILPEILGDFIWDTNETVVYNPGSYFAPQTQYTVRINTSVSDEFGGKLPQPFTCSFQTDPLRITSYYPQNGATHIGISTQIVITFNAAMNQNSVETAFSILPAVDGTLIWDNYYQFRYRTTMGFATETEYQIRIDTGCQDKSGKSLPGEFTLIFTTAP